jgi:hypothetical protein
MATQRGLGYACYMRIRSKVESADADARNFSKSGVGTFDFRPDPTHKCEKSPFVYSSGLAMNVRLWSSEEK